ncbi:hypothetical protein C5L25_000409 [Secundilactobacillus silagei JCM 19001]|uniref:Glycosyltransferase n=2 Tax=Secundilactobacillus silagei TaxID=1293415 RepID=A0A1Z5IGS0_9LACO|nr:hypothetical protein C5L25_000409 [Secundilactobacillus silagei JCM 19001]GAX00631.1 glycosyltransferase [Secundilactobacillus silagei JCM 19001]
MPKNTKIYLPVLVGAKKNWNKNINYQRDDEGTNISGKNSSYSELTAIYWAWKNLKNVDYVGLVHYRRFFFNGFKKRKIENVLDDQKIQSILKQSKVILPKKRKYYIETNYSHYIHAHHKKPLTETRNVISSIYPEYLSYFDQVMSKRSAHMFNMFIMKKELFDKYCQWLFKILEDVEDKIDITNYSIQEKRVFGYISELLLDVWVLANNIKYKEVSWGITGKNNRVKKMYYFMKRKYGMRTKTHF